MVQDRSDRKDIYWLSLGSGRSQYFFQSVLSIIISFHHFSSSLVVTGGVANASLPKTLAAGNYLIRHEIIALHLATSFGGAEFYPACAQIKVGGSETGAPTAEELVSIPGAYSDNDPGIFDPNVFDTSAPYVFPGPAIASFVGATSSGTSSSSNSNTPTSSTTPPKSSTSRKCRIKKASPTSVTDVRKRHWHSSRIMPRKPPLIQLDELSIQVVTS
jgi:hypothetical protein